MAKFVTNNLYDMNKQLVEKYEKSLKGKPLLNRINNVVIPYLKSKNTETYFMLLCNERKDYTVFRISDINNESNADKIAEQIKICLLNRGAIYGMDITSDKVALEIWIKSDEDGEMSCYYFFPYSQAVIEI